jgi:hypothetical protein
LAWQLTVRPRRLYKWRAKLEALEPGEEASRPSTHATSYRREIQQLKRLLTQKRMEVDFFSIERMCQWFRSVAEVSTDRCKSGDLPKKRL